MYCQKAESCSAADSVNAPHLLICSQGRVGHKHQLLRGLQELCKVAGAQAGIRGRLQRGHRELQRRVDAQQGLPQRAKSGNQVLPREGPCMRTAASLAWIKSAEKRYMQT